jgi:transcriptional regulator with XRE-family HTH domain
VTLEELRVLRGLGPAQAADEIGVSYRTLRRVEEDPMSATVSTLHKIAVFYGLDPVPLYYEGRVVELGQAA